MATNTVEIPEITTPVETVSKRLNRARIAFSKKQIKKSGHNGFLKFDYFTLDDIIPAAREVLTAEELSIAIDKIVAEIEVEEWQRRKKLTSEVRLPST